MPEVKSKAVNFVGGYKLQLEVKSPAKTLFGAHAQVSCKQNNNNWLIFKDQSDPNAEPGYQQITVSMCNLWTLDLNDGPPLENGYLLGDSGLRQFRDIELSKLTFSFSVLRSSGVPFGSVNVSTATTESHENERMHIGNV